MRGSTHRDGKLQAVWLACALLAALASGCATTAKYRDPVRVTVSDIQIVEATLLEQLYTVTLRVQNPNEHAMTVRGGSFDLRINGQDFGHGVSDSNVAVPAFGDAKVEVRMVSTLFGMLRLIRGFENREGEPLSYDISGRLHLEGVFGGLSFSEAGELAFPQDAGTPET